MNRAMVSKYQGNALDMTRSRRYLSLITGVIVAGLVTFIPELEPYRGQLYFSIALLTGLLMGLYGVEDIVNAFISGRLPELVSPPAAPQQPPSSPPAAPPIPPEPIEATPLPHATIPIENSGTVLKIDEREAWTPKGFDYEYVAQDGNGKHWVHLNAHFGNYAGLRLNIDGLAGMFDYTLKDAITLPNGQPFTAWVWYDGDIAPNAASVPDPLDTWARWELWVDGVRISSAALANGDQHPTFNFTGTGKPQKLTFRLYLKWAGFHEQSVLTWLEAGYGHTIGEGLA